MGLWKRTADGTIHIDFAVNDNCWNMEAQCYGTCYWCGCSVKDKKQRYENRIRYLRDMIEEQEHFDNWFDKPETRALQAKNVKANIRWFKRKLRYYEKKLKAEG